MDVVPDTEDRIAVVVVDGMGEQRPLEALKRFTDSAQATLGKGGTRAHYSRPALLTGSYEARRHRSSWVGVALLLLGLVAGTAWALVRRLLREVPAYVLGVVDGSGFTAALTPAAYALSARPQPGGRVEHRPDGHQQRWRPGTAGAPRRGAHRRPAGRRICWRPPAGRPVQAPPDLGSANECQCRPAGRRGVSALAVVDERWRVGNTQPGCHRPLPGPRRRSDAVVQLPLTGNRAVRSLGVDLGRLRAVPGDSDAGIAARSLGRRR